jgi:hypothetical protein
LAISAMIRARQRHPRSITPYTDLKTALSSANSTVSRYPFYKTP